MKQYILGIELGSTRIKSVLTDENAAVIAQGSYEWENELTDGLWSYPLELVEEGLRKSYASLAESFVEKTGCELERISAIGISAMMHGYLAFDCEDKLLVPFRTWRNTNTDRAAKELGELFKYNIPMRWSVAHYYQAILNNEPHVSRVKHLNTLAGYVHFKLTGKRVLGIGDASGMFPVSNGSYDKDMLASFNRVLEEKGVFSHFEELLPTVLTAGEDAGTLTREGAKWLDPTGKLKAGCLLCPPEGDAGTGMVATNSIMPCTANISAGTSAFLMAVLERPLSAYYKEIDLVATPHGSPVAMVHINNFASEITAWAKLFYEVIALCGGTVSTDKLYEAMYTASLSADGDIGGLVGYNFLAGEPMAGVEKGMLLVARAPSGRLNIANFMKMHIYSALGSLAIGCRILEKEKVKINSVCGHGGFFKTPVVGQSAMSAAVGAPVTVMKNAGEGGAWGIALLALFAHKKEKDLGSFLNGVFSGAESTTVFASEEERASFAAFMKKYEKGLDIERMAADKLQ